MYDTLMILSVVFSPGFPAINMVLPFFNSIGASQIVVLISGPLVSIRIAILSETNLALLMSLSAPSISACAEFILMTSIPSR